jgi:hypothetical protein
MPTGLWKEPGVPHKGWSCVGTTDLREDDPEADLATCEMCEVQEIRYVHHMTHPDFEHELDVGCHCAEKMEEDYKAARSREAPLRAAAARRQKWMRGPWQALPLRGEQIESLGYRVIIEPVTKTGWGGSITRLSTGKRVRSGHVHESSGAAKLAAYLSIEKWRRARRLRRQM